jgi:tagatose 1,6-diphosphate aldolase
MRWHDPGRLIDGELELVLRFRSLGDPERQWSPAYHFDMVRTDIGQKVGQIDLRIGDSHHLTHYAGQIGYGVDEPHRGHRYAARSVKLLLPLAQKHGLDPLWITCNPDNWASRRSCELAGAILYEIVDLPEDTDMYREGERQKCRYRIDLAQ